MENMTYLGKASENITQLWSAKSPQRERETTFRTESTESNKCVTRAVTCSSLEMSRVCTFILLYLACRQVPFGDRWVRCLLWL